MGLNAQTLGNSMLPTTTAMNINWLVMMMKMDFTE